MVLGPHDDTLLYWDLMVLLDRVHISSTYKYYKSWTTNNLCCLLKYPLPTDLMIDRQYISIIFV
jgi:hypothetical protein